MRLGHKIMLGVLGAAVILTAAVYVYLNQNGRRIFNEQASLMTNRKVSVEAIRAALPAAVELDGLKVEGLLSARRVRVDLDAWALLGGKVHVLSAEVDTPDLVIDQSAVSGADEGKSGAAVQGASGAASASASSAVARPSSAPIILGQLTIRYGTIRFHSAANKRDFILEKVEAVLHQVPLDEATPVKTDLFVTASLEKINAPFVGHFLKAKGWLNWAARGMDVSAQAIDDNGHVGMDALLKGAGNDLQVTGTMRLAGSQQPQA
ncbi:MAG: hypothetical protein HQL19_03785, partial [Candidatus Omnitrophica bacterium]|nr:hypothetical protein [Candidatus Omnitrophota bacterium]